MARQTTGTRVRETFSFVGAVRIMERREEETACGCPEEQRSWCGAEQCKGPEAAGTWGEQQGAGVLEQSVGDEMGWGAGGGTMAPASSA